MRNIVWSEHFSQQVEKAGGARLVDEALAPIMDGLVRNPYGFGLHETDYFSFRYAKTQALPGKLGALTIIFTVNDVNDVVLEWYDEDLPF